MVQAASKGDRQPGTPRPWAKAVAAIVRDGGDIMGGLGYLLLTPLLLAYLGMAQYGLMAIVGALLGWLGLLELGVKPNLARLLRQALDGGQPERVNELLSSAVALLAGLGVGCLFGATLLAATAERAFQLPAAVAPACAAYVLVKGLQLTLSLPLSAFEAGNHGTGDRGSLGAIRALGAVMEVVAGLATIWLDLGLEGLAWLTLIGALATGMMQRHALLARLPDLRLSWRSVRRDPAREVAGAGAFVAINGATVLLVYQSDELVIGAVLGAGAVATYSIVGVTSRALIPLAARVARFLQAGGDPEIGDRARLGPRFARDMDGGLMVAGGLAALFMVFGADLLEGWLGTPVPQAVALALGGVVATSAPVVVATRHLTGPGMARRLLKSSLVEGAANLMLSLALIVPLGLSGVALATGLSQVATTTWYAPRLVCLELGLAPGAFARRRLATALAVTAPAATLATGMLLWQPARSPTMLATQIAICAAVHGIVCFVTWMLTWGRRRDV